jgi:hypothetical protein
MDGKLADLRSDFELLEAETFEILDYEEEPEMLGASSCSGTSTSSGPCSCSTCASCTSTNSCN